jgi:methionyl-tRNA formyltransferase
MGAKLLLESLGNPEQVLQRAQPQDESLVSYAPRLTKQQAEIDWNKPLTVLLREIRAFNPWPVSYTFLENENLRIWTAGAGNGLVPDLPGRVIEHDGDGLYVSCADGVLQVTELQYAGRSRCSAGQAQNAKNLSGLSLGRRT